MCIRDRYISTESTTVLLLDGNCKAEDILEKHRKADYIITDKDGDICKIFAVKELLRIPTMQTQKIAKI